MADKEHEIPVKVVDRRWWANADTSPGAETRADAPTSLKPTYVEELEQKVAEKDKQAQEYIAKYRQAAGEFEEARLRLRREVSKDVERARREILSDLLEIVDNLDRAIDAGRRSGSSPESLLQGVEMVQRQFLSKLEGLGVKPIESTQTPFDHRARSGHHRARDVTGSGYYGRWRHPPGIPDRHRVLRPAAVAVAKA